MDINQVGVAEMAWDHNLESVKAAESVELSAAPLGEQSAESSAKRLEAPWEVRSGALPDAPSGARLHLRVVMHLCARSWYEV